jgi:hypothetical protein
MYPSHSKWLPLAASIVFALTGWASAAPVLINFDDRPGLPEPPPFFDGTPVPAQFFVHDEYLPLGVRFDSGGGGIAILWAENAVSFPNSAAATGPGPVISYQVPVTATFFINGLPAVVDFVRLDLSDSSSRSTLMAFDQNGVLLGSSSGGASSTLGLTFPASIHSVVLQQGPVGFDNFTFDGLVAVPEPGTMTLFAAGAVWLAVTIFYRRRKKTAA